ncbi:MAG: ABC transporter permease, partial [Treponema sp.]|nr:ABC transporter permease [Treponema sp.]
MKGEAAFFIALRYLWGRAHEGGRYLRGAAAGIAVSLIPIIVTLIVADGMIRGITDRYLELGTGHLQVFEMFSSGDEESTIETIKALDGVKGVWPERRSMGVLAGKKGKTGVTVRAVEPSFWEETGAAAYLKIIDGAQKPETSRDIMLGEPLASSIGAQVGDTIRLMTIRTNDAGRPSPRTAPFTVRSIVSCGYNEIDSLWCVISWEGGKSVLSPDQSTSSMMIKIDDPYKKADFFAWLLYSQLGTGYNVYTWKELLRSQYSSYESTRQMLLFIMAIIVIVAAVNVSSATSMLALERQRDIAVLKVSGMPASGVTRIFIWGGFLTGLIGGIIGIVSGLLIG